MWRLSGGACREIDGAPGLREARELAAAEAELLGRRVSLYQGDHWVDNFDPSLTARAGAIAIGRGRSSREPNNQDFADARAGHLLETGQPYRD